MEIIFAIVLGGASLVAVIAAGLRRAERERQATVMPPAPAARLRSEPTSAPAPPTVAPKPTAAPKPTPAPTAPAPAAPPAAEPEPTSLAAPPPAAPLAAEPAPVSPAISPPSTASKPPAPVAPPTPSETPTAADDPELNDLIAWGQSGQTVYLSLLSHYRYHPSAAYRGQTAMAMGAIAAANPPRHEVLRSVDTLAQLIGDGEPAVRRAAIAALAYIRDPRVVPLLRRAQRDSDSEVVQLASEAIARCKRLPNPQPAKPSPARRPKRAPEP